MDEFLRIKWRPEHPSELEDYAQSTFLPEEWIASSLAYQDHPTNQDEDKEFSKLFKYIDYTPGLNEIPTQKTNIQSALDQRGHQFCLKALKIIQSGKDRTQYTSQEQYSVETYNKLKLNVLQENAKYQNYVAQQWQEKDKNLQPFNACIVGFGKSIWERKKLQAKSYPQFYKELGVINTNLLEEELIEFNCLEDRVNLDTVAQFCNPGLKSPCNLNPVNLASEKNIRKLPLSEDNGVLNILQAQGDINVVISSSGIKCLANTTETGKWILPVVVKRVSNEKQVAFFEKPFALNDVSKKDLALISYKRLVKTQFCLPEPSCKTTYRKWHVKKTHCQNNLMKTHHKPIDLRVLVRSKTVASEATNTEVMQEVILKPKLEQQPKYGANIATKSELIAEWASLFFRPFANLYRVRILPKKGEVICLEKCHLQKVIAEAQNHYHHKPQLGLGILQKVFEDVGKLGPGFYLLQHLPKNGAFVTIFKQSDEQKFDFYKELDKRAISDGINWVPIDCNFILPGFDKLERMPGMFEPRKNGLKRKQKQNKLNKTNKKIVVKE